MAYRTLKDKKLGGAGVEYFGIFEVNNMTAQEIRTKGSLPLDLEDFMDDEGGSLPCEQGMLLVYDEAIGVVRKAKNVNEKVMIHNSDYKLYDTKWSLKDFTLWPQKGSEVNMMQYIIDEYGRVTLGPDGKPQVDTVASKKIHIYEDTTPFPRMNSCVTNDIFTTNTVIYSTDDFGANDDAFEAIAAAVEDGQVFAVVAVPDTDIPKAWGGYYKLVKSATAPTATNVFKAVLAYDLPDGQPALRFEVWN